MKEDIESEVRNYCRCYPAMFAEAKGSYVIAQTDDKYLDFGRLRIIKTMGIMIR
ncbi:hypothetical protein [Mesorhizobium sp.]|uniref:hypothetical protein n=1 Tax=Mesorhizobium sp. TaxID=1871066 RepID=UPI0025D843D1|nr:hypothetical protein [Mesorhizobium sp.]